MRSAHFLLAVLVILSLTSCVGTKRLTYLQPNEENTDSLVSIRKTPPAYRLQVHDLLSIRVKALDQETVGLLINPVDDQEPTASREERLYYDGFTVDRRGNIRVPNLGEVPVLGLTVEEVREEVEKRLRSQFFQDDADLFVTVKLSGIRYTINGEIGSPGSRVIYSNQVTIMEAIGNSGDIPSTGDKQNVVIIRQYPMGQKIHHIDLTTIDAMESPYYYIQPNDQIIINPLAQKALGTGTTGLQSFTTILTVITALTTTILLFIRL